RELILFFQLLPEGVCRFKFQPFTCKKFASPLNSVRLEHHSLLPVTSSFGTVNLPKCGLLSKSGMARLSLCTPVRGELGTLRFMAFVRRCQQQSAQHLYAF